jgi:hypothetical protein
LMYRLVFPAKCRRIFFDEQVDAGFDKVSFGIEELTCYRIL